MVKRKELLRVLPVLILFLIVLAYCIYLFSYVEPKIDFKAQITEVSSADYQRLLENKQMVSQNKGIEKFKHISVDIKVTTPFGPAIINSINLEKDSLRQYLIKDDRIQTLSGGGSDDTYKNEYSDHIEIYLKDISEEQLRTLLKDFKVKVTWQNIWHSYNERIFYLGDYLNK
ncbi:hypothetical protein [Desulfitobacterium sp.]|uniref:hypothetical protein n=1 Tax=Desulfitobacterium sp. TaxID=49981 RepID=UPI002BDC4D09|nr:hypothetical protein [Desulfitobacterium sp.]HVJ47628.1 hypothetical protein [Desulfitobacterium sp.]